MNEEFCLPACVFVNIVNIGIRLKHARLLLLCRGSLAPDIYLANCSWRPLSTPHCFELHFKLHSIQYKYTYKYKYSTEAHFSAQN